LRFELRALLVEACRQLLHQFADKVVCLLDHPLRLVDEGGLQAFPALPETACVFS
jgi:hypothetical protein